MRYKGLRLYVVYGVLLTVREGAPLAALAADSTIARYTGILTRAGLLTPQGGRYALTEKGEEVLNCLTPVMKDLMDASA